ncbi:hypothetical protein, partial [Tepidimonas sp.]|uniref:hypothetical protein n=1 Tax=Tepidimonas sp. TaxID=2002775 RepID=UPI003919CA5E
IIEPVAVMVSPRNQSLKGNPMSTINKTLSAASFEAGRVAGMAHGNWLAESVMAIGDLLPAALTAAQYKTIRGQWVKGYVKAMGCKETTAQNQWAKVWKGVEAAFGAKKPQSKEAARKAAQRAKAEKPTKADKADKAAGKADNEPKAPASGEEAAKGIQMTLSAMEAHIVKKIRAGQFGIAIECIHKLAETHTA